MFLAFALGLAEVLDADRIYAGMNAVDYSGYPDCRPAYIDAFQELANLATKRGVEGRPIRLHAPLLLLSKAEIVRRGSHWASTSPRPCPATRRRQPGRPAGTVTPAACAGPALSPLAWRIPPAIAKMPRILSSLNRVHNQGIVFAWGR